MRLRVLRLAYARVLFNFIGCNYNVLSIAKKKIFVQFSMLLQSSRKEILSLGRLQLTTLNIKSVHWNDIDFFRPHTIRSKYKCVNTNIKTGVGVFSFERSIFFCWNSNWITVIVYSLFVFSFDFRGKHLIVSIFFQRFWAVISHVCRKKTQKIINKTNCILMEF